MQALYDWIFHQNPDGSGLSLKAVGLVLGALLLGGHLFAWKTADTLLPKLKGFPRNRSIGVALMVVVVIWTMFLVSYMDMGEFFKYRKTLLYAVPITGFLVISYVTEFLAVRALGTLLLLLASPVLTAAFLQEPTSRLLLSILAYVWIIGGMFLIGMPYLLRDGIDKLIARPALFKQAALAGAVYGLLILICALLFY